MPAPFAFLYRFLQDPPPEFVFEISSESVRMAIAAEPDSISVEPLPAGVISPSPLHENVVLSEPLREAVERLLPREARGKKRRAALLLPDHCAHVSVLDFDDFPAKPDEQMALVKFRLRKSIPFDLDSAAISYFVQAESKEKGVVVAVTALDIVSRYEAPFRSLNVQPGFVTLAPLACLDLVESPGIVAVARLSGNVLTLLVRQNRALRLMRSIELSDLSIAEISNHLHPTLVFIEDNLGAPASELFLAGFGLLEAEALRDYPDEFRLPVKILGAGDTGIRGYLKGAA